MGKSSHHKTENKFKFQTFSERISQVDIDVIHRVVHHDDTPEENLTFFGEAIEKWTELNCTQHFADFRKEISSQVQTFTQLVHHKEDIVAALTKHLQIPNSLALDAILDLTVQLSRDLQKDFVVYFPKFFQLLVKLLNSQDVELLEQVFTALAYLFKHLWRYLVKDIQNVYRYFSELLGENHKEYIRNFAAESFAFLMRKAKNPSELFDFMFQTLEEHSNRTEGTGRLLFEMIKGVKGQMHSCIESILPIILTKLGPVGKMHKKSKLPLDLVTMTISYMFTCVSQYISKDHVGSVWSVLLTTLNSVYDSCGNVPEKKKNLMTNYLTRIVELTNQIVQYKSGFLVTEPDKIAKILIEILNSTSLDQDIKNEVIDLVTSLVLTSHTSLSVENSVKLISMVIKKDVPCDVVYKFVKSLIDLPLFEKDVLPALVVYTDTLLKSGAHKEETLQLLTDIVLHKVPLPQDGGDLEDNTDYVLDYGKNRKHVVKYLIDIVTETLDNSVKDVTKMWSALVCLPHVRPLTNKDKLIKDILGILEKLHSLKDNVTDDQLFVIYQIFVCLLKLQTDGEMFTWIGVDVVKSLVSYHRDNVHILRAVDLYYTKAVEDDNSEVLTEDRLLELYTFLEDNLSSPQSPIRKLSLRIMSHFDIRLPSLEDQSGQVGVFRICLDAETTPLSVQCYREKQMFLQKIEFNAVQHQIPIGPFTQIPLRYLLGCLFLNFKYLWEPVRKLVATHAQGLKKDDFWRIFLAHLQKYSNSGSMSKQEPPDITEDQDDITSCFITQKSTLSSTDEIDYNNFRIQMWKTMQLFPQLCESKSRDIVPLFLEFLKQEYYSVDDVFAPSQNLLKVGVSDDSKMETDEKVTVLETKTSRKHVTSTLLSHLQLLALFTNPKSLYKEAELKNIYMELLRHKNGEIQKVVFKCVMTYKPPYLVPYRENFERLMDDKTFKNEIVAFSLEEETSVIKTEHRNDLLPVLMRILYGKMLSKTGKDSSGKSKSNFRRTIVFRFIMGCQPQEICTFLEMVFSSFQAFTSEDALTLVEDLSKNIDLTAVTPIRKMSGGLHSVDLIMNKLGHRIEDYLDSLLKILLGITGTVVYCLEHREELSPFMVTPLKNARHMCVDSLTKFFEDFVSYKFTEREIEAVFTVSVWPQLSKLTYEGIYHPTPLMKLMNVWSQHSRYFLLLTKTKPDDKSCYPLLYIFKLLNVKEASVDVKRYIVQIIYNLLMSEDDTQPINVGETCYHDNMECTDTDKGDLHLHLGIQLLVPHVPSILQHIQQTVVGVKLRDKQVTRELQILSKLSEFVTDQSQCSTLVKLLVPFLAEGVHRSQNVENDILKSIRNLLRIVDNRGTFFKTICSLCGHTQNRQGRSLLCNILEVISSGNESMEKIASLVSELNAWDPKRVEDPDYLRRLAGFREVNSIIKSMTTLDTQFLYAILVNSCFFIKMVDDLSLRDNATNCLVVMVTQFSQVEYDQDVFREIIGQGLLPEVKKGVRNKDENIRHEFILLLSKLVDTFPSNPMFTDLTVLKDKDVEADFFENIRHIQTHRKSRALRRMIKLLQNTPMKKEIITSYLLPITESFLTDDKYSKTQNVLDVSVESLGVLCRLLPWQQYSFHLKFYLGQLQKRLDKNKHYVKIIVVILDAFHFDLRNSEYAEKGVPQPAEESVYDGEETKLEESVQEVDEESLVSTDKVICSAAMATRIHLAISRSFIPQLQRYLTEKIKSDEEHKMAGQSLYPEDTEILRVPLALAMVKLLQNLPQKTLEQSLPGILLKVCNFLKSRAKDIRVTARDTLVKIVLSLGPRYFPYVLSELRGTLRRGYQLHVLGFTVHTILRNMSESIKPGDLDFCRASLQQIFHEELFGNVAEEKDVDAIKGKVFEAKTMKSYDSYSILAKFIGMGSLSALLTPLKQVLDSTQSLKSTKKVQEALRKISFGLIENSGIDVEKTMIFIHSLITIQENKPSAKKVEEKKGLRPESCLLLPPTPEYGGGKPKPNKKTNTHVLVEFGLEILYLLLKRSKITHQNPDHIKLIDPFIVIIKDNLQAKHIRVNIMCLRCLGWLLKFPLPSLKTNIQQISQGIFYLLKNYASVGAAKGDNFELVSLLFKTVTVLVRDVKFHSIDENQLHVLLTFCEEDLYDHNRQSTAFSLFRAILSRKLHTEEIEQIVKKIQEMSITADSAHIRRECRQIISQYLMDYPVGKSLVGHLEYYVTQLSYQIDTGRESALEMLATIFSTFPQTLLVKYSGLFFIPMSAALMNDTSPKCRKLTALAIKSLLQQIDQKTRNDLFRICVKWFSEEKISLRTLAVLVCGLFVEVENTKFTSRLSTILPLVEKDLGAYSTETEGNEDLDQLLYNILNMFTKVCTECNIIRDSQYSEQLSTIWGHVKTLLLYPHNWVRTTAAQLFGLLFAAWNPEDVSKKCSKPEYLQTDSIQRDLSGDFVSQLQSHYLNTELADQVIKNMVFIAKVTKHLPETENHRLSLPWLVRKMVREANHEVVSNSVSTMKRSSIFKWIAAISIDLGADLLGSVLHLCLPAIQRETLDSSSNTDTDLKKLAGEVMDVIKQIVGVDQFTTVYSEVMKKRSINKETRKRKQAVTAVTHPEIAARRKLKKNLNKKETKKRKLEDFRVSKKIKSKKLKPS